MRRWQIVGVVAGVVLAATAGPAWRASREQGPQGASSAPAPAGPSLTRPLVYAEGQAIHLGDRTIRTGVDLLSLAVNDDGAAYTTIDGLLWFTDGATVRQIGLTTPGRVSTRGVGWSPAGRPNDRIVADYAGSRLAWLEYPRIGAHREPPELVVYDSREGRRVARVPLRPAGSCPTCARIISVHGDHVDWTDGPTNGLGTSAQRLNTTPLHRYTLSTGREATFSVAAHQAELRSRARTLVVGESLEAGTVGDAVGQDFVLDGRRLVAGGRGVSKSTFDPRTGRRIVLNAPSALWKDFRGELFYLFEWLDDDTVALLDGSHWGSGRRLGEDMLACTLSSGECRVVPRRSTSDRPPIVPEFETPGADLALARAARTQVLSGR